MRPWQATAIVLGGLVLGSAAGLSARFYLGRRRADYAWATTRYPKLKNWGVVKQLSILPLVDWYPARPDLAGEPGVAYLIRADDTTILFDVGLNERGEHPSPLLRNAQALSVNLQDLDLIVISHLHLDHVGGMKNQRKRTFSLSGQATDLSGLTVLVPEPMTHPTASIKVIDAPQSIAPGVASIGPIPRQLFFLGWTPEQALAINVEGKGLVLVIGCGHPTLPRLIERVEALFDEPLYGVVGGLHYPVTGARTVKLGIPMQRIVGTGKWPWNPISKQEVQSNIAYLQRRNPRLVALSPHDSCDWSLQAFREVFGMAYQDIQVGKEIGVG